MMHPPFHKGIFALLLLLVSSGIVCGQKSLYVDPGLWSKIDYKLNQNPPPSRYTFIPQLVEAHFKNRPDSIYPACFAIMIRLERKFNLEAAITVGRAMAQTAAQQGNLGREAIAYENLARYYDALGVYRLAALRLEKARDLYLSLGDTLSTLQCEHQMLGFRLHFVNREKILPLLENLLAQTVALEAERLSQQVRLQLLEQYLLAGRFEKVGQHLPYLDELTESDPIKPREYPLLINAAKFKGDLALARGRLDEAEGHFRRTLMLCRAEPGPWFEIFTLNALARLEMKRGQLAQAKNFLEESRAKAEKLNLDDLLAETYALKSEVAERENDPGDALRYLKKKMYHEEKFNARSGGFDLENYYLQAERDRLLADERSRILELDLKETQLHYSVIILTLLALLAVGFVLGYIQQRRRKTELADRNFLIQQQADELASLDAAKSRFFANISHELRTPLSLIVGPLATLLSKGEQPDKHTALLRTAQRSARQLETLVNNILDLRKLEAGKMPLNPEPTQLNAFFQLHLEQFQSLAQWRQIRYTHNIRIAPSLVADLDREKCRQILYNLLSNAFKFTPAAGSVEVIVEMSGDQLSIQVDDTGVGIHSDDLPQLFDRFFQGSRKGGALSGGTGIGLSICQEYVHLMQGDIQANSQPGAGSVFNASWPVALSEIGSSPAPLAVSELPASHEGSVPLLKSVVGESPPTETASLLPTLLIVEDNPGLREYLGLVLCDTYHVRLAENGAVALQMLAEVPAVDLVLSDLMMPVMDGYELLEKLKADDATRHLPFLMLTARAEPTDRLRALRLGVDDYLTKPFEEEELLVRIANLLKNQAMRRLEGEPSDKEPVAPATPPTRLSEAEQTWLENFEQYVRDYLASDALTIPALGEAFAMSESTLLRQLKRLTGLSPAQYLQQMRLDEARRRLENGEPVATVARRVGYKDARSFSRSFKRRFGKLPRNFPSRF